jgi:hypothetical protein
VRTANESAPEPAFAFLVEIDQHGEALVEATHQFSPCAVGIVKLEGVARARQMQGAVVGGRVVLGPAALIGPQLRREPRLEPAQGLAVAARDFRVAGRELGIGADLYLVGVLNDGETVRAAAAEAATAAAVPAAVAFTGK